MISNSTTHFVKQFQSCSDLTFENSCDNESADIWVQEANCRSDTTEQKATGGVADHISITSLMEQQD